MGFSVLQWRPIVYTKYMLHIQYIRENADKVATAAQQKGYEVDIKQLLAVDSSRRSAQQHVDELRTQRNEIAATIKKSAGAPDKTLIEKGRELKEELSEREAELRGLDDQYAALMKSVPNMPLSEVPVGATEDENIVARQWGRKPQFEFEPKSHAAICYEKGWLDKERAAKVTGARFAYLKGGAVKLQFALIQWMMDFMSDKDNIERIVKKYDLNVSTKPFMPILTPLMLRTDIYDAMDRLEPREDRYKIADEELWLQGSAEHVLGSMYANEAVDSTDLPLRFIGYATSFRREAGTYGKDMEGTFRMHQFDKLELESLTAQEDGKEEHRFMVALQEEIMQALGLHYQVLQKCTADIGKPNASGYDIEAWLPSQDTYRETHTADYMTDFQARRLKTRYRDENGEMQFVHTNDATALPLSRGPIAIVEQYQTADGDVVVPEVLRSYLGGLETI